MVEPIKPADRIDGAHYSVSKIAFDGWGANYLVSTANPLPVAIIGGGGGGSSGGLTNTELRAAPVPVSGTVAVTGAYPATQPISGAVSISGSVGVTGPLTDTQLRASAVSVTFTNGSLAVSGPLTDAQLRATAVPVSGTVAANINGTVPVGIAATVATRDLKDAGRALKVFSATFSAATTEGLVTLTPITDGAAGSTGTSFGVTAGKKLRLQSMSVATKNAGAAAQGVICNIRMTATGAVAANSPLIGTCGAGTFLAIANVAGGNTLIFPDGLELSGTQQFGISQIGTATAGNTVTLIAYEY